jgi:hypothetical protein
MRSTSILLAFLLACSGGSDSAGPVDVDGDGFSPPDDCDDNNAEAAPGLDEVCDNVDNNCDERVDEGLMQTYYADHDRDGFGNPDLTYARCIGGDGFVLNDDDCDDDDEDVGDCK